MRASAYIAGFLQTPRVVTKAKGEKTTPPTLLESVWATAKANHEQAGTPPKKVEGLRAFGTPLFLSKTTGPPLTFKSTAEESRKFHELLKRSDPIEGPCS